MLSGQQFLTERHDPHTPPSPLTQSHPQRLFLLPGMKEVLKGKRCADVKEVKQKMAEALKGIKIDEFKNCSEPWNKKVWLGILHQVQNTLKVASLNM